ncbi:leucine-rich repeat protein, partial [Acinetobacter baumannii]|nr:leucine-rich repeat protein [Acinetobacter baumannii]
SKLREIGLQAFNGNTLISVSIPDSVIKVGAGAFSVNTDMTSIKLSNSMKTVPEGICARNTSLTSVTIPNGVEV